MEASSSFYHDLKSLEGRGSFETNPQPPSGTRHRAPRQGCSVHSVFGAQSSAIFQTPQTKAGMRPALCVAVPPSNGPAETGLLTGLRGDPGGKPGVRWPSHPWGGIPPPPRVSPGSSRAGGEGPRNTKAGGSGSFLGRFAPVFPKTVVPGWRVAGGLASEGLASPEVAAEGTSEVLRAARPVSPGTLARRPGMASGLEVTLREYLRALACAPGSGSGT